MPQKLHASLSAAASTVFPALVSGVSGVFPRELWLAMDTPRPEHYTLRCTRNELRPVSLYASVLKVVVSPDQPSKGGQPRQTIQYDPDLTNTLPGLEPFLVVCDCSHGIKILGCQESHL